LPHRRHLEGLPRFGPPETTAPALGRRDQVRISGVIARGGDLVFRADGPELAPGIYREPRRGGEADLLLPDPPGHVLLDPISAGALLAVHRSARGRVPSQIDVIALYDSYGVETVVPGQSIGVAGSGEVAAVVDLGAKLLRRVDLTNRQVTEAAALIGGIDPQLAPIVSLDHAGSAALLMDAREERGDASLLRIDLATGATDILFGPLPAPAWATGAFVPGGDEIIALEMRLGDTPRARVLRCGAGGDRATLLELQLSQPASTPVLVGPNLVALPLSLAPHPLATYGPVDLVAIPLTGGAVFSVTHAGDVHGRARLVEDALLVEGGSHLIRVPILSPKL